MRWSIIGFLALSVAGCASGEPINTASGRPDVTAHNVDVECIRTTLIGGMMNNGWTVRRADGLQIVAEKAMESTAGNMLAVATLTRGSGGSMPNRQITLTIMPVNNDVRMVVDAQWVINPGNARSEYTIPIKWTASDQNDMTALAWGAESKCPKR